MHVIRHTLESARSHAVWVAVLVLMASIALSGLATASLAYAEEEQDAPDPFEDAATIEVEDGEYLIDVELAGGSGKADVLSPATLEVVDGRGVATVVWTSPYYDYMLVNDKKYLSTVEVGRDSTFRIPVTAYDEAMEVVGDTTAMSEPHEIDYTLTFDSGSIQEFDESLLPEAEAEDGSAEDAAGSGAEGASESEIDGASQDSAAASDGSAASSVQGGSGLTWPWMVFIACAVLSAVVIGLAIGLIRGYRNQ